MVICGKRTHSHTIFNVGRMLGRSTCEKVKNLQKSLSKPVIHNTIDNWIDHRIWHCQPIDGQVKVLNRLTWVNVNKQLTRSAYLNVFPIVNRWIDVVVNKVQVVRQPTDPKNYHYCNHHFDHLKNRLIFWYYLTKIVGFLIIMLGNLKQKGVCCKLWVWNALHRMFWSLTKHCNNIHYERIWENLNFYWVLLLSYWRCFSWWWFGILKVYLFEIDSNYYFTVN